MTGRRILAVVFGALGVVVGVALIVGAATVLIGDRDPDGYVMTDSYPFRADGRAIVLEDVDLFAEVPGGLEGWITEPTDLRLQGARADGGGLFMGIAPADRVDRYLTAVAYHEITGFELDEATITEVAVRDHLGVISTLKPRTQDIWVAWAGGDGPQTLDWTYEPGDWAVIMMNGDRSAGIDVELALGAKNTNTMVLTWMAMLAGAVLFVGGGYLVYRGLRPSEPERVIEVPEGAPPVPREPIPTS